MNLLAETALLFLLVGLSADANVAQTWYEAK